MEPVTKVKNVASLVRATRTGFDDEITVVRKVDHLLLDVCKLRPRQTERMKKVQF